MKNNLFILLCFAATQWIWSQSITDKVFNNVIRLDDRNVTVHEKDVLIDTPIKSSKNTLVFYVGTEKIPLDLFCNKHTFLDDQNEIILIVPDWEYYKFITEKERKTPGLRLDPYREQSIFYHIKRGHNTYTKDSIVRSMEVKPFLINLKTDQVAPATIKYYWINYQPKELGEEYLSKILLLNMQLKCDVLKGNFKDYTNIARMRTTSGAYELLTTYYTFKDVPENKRLMALKGLRTIFENGNSPPPRIYVVGSYLTNNLSLE